MDGNIKQTFTTQKKETQNRHGKFVSVGRASAITGLCAQTLRILADNKTLASYKTPTGHRKFDLQDLQKMCHPTNIVQEIKQSKKKNFIYTRVSSRKQMDDLSRQTEYLQSKRNGEFASFDIIQDIGSGINFKRKGFNTILDACVQGVIGTVVIAHRDRLCRFGFELIQSIIEKSGGNIIITDDEQHKSSEQELSEDLLSIVHIYSCRQMGKYKCSTIESTASSTIPIA